MGDAYGLDMSERAVAFCVQRGLTQVAHLYGSLSRSKPFGQSFDLITMLDTLEHVDEVVRGLISVLEQQRLNVFSTALPVERLGLGTHLLRLKILSADRQQYYWSEHTWTVHIR